MKLNHSILLFSILLIIPLASASCLTSTEQSTIQQMFNDTNSSGIIMVNLFERLCNIEPVNSAIASFNSSIQAQITENNNATQSQLNTFTSQINSQLNNSALVQTLQQIANMYNASITITNSTGVAMQLIAQSEGRTNSRMDNQSLSLINQFTTLQTDVNSQLTTKQTNSLSTNRIILIIFGVIVLAGVFWYFTHKKVPYKPNLSPLPFEMPANRYDEDKSINTGKVKGKPAK